MLRATWGTLLAAILIAITFHQPVSAKTENLSPQEIRAMVHYAVHRLPRLNHQLEAIRLDIAEVDSRLLNQYGFRIFEPLAFNRAALKGKTQDELTALIETLLSSTEVMDIMLTNLIGQYLVTIEEIERFGDRLPPESRAALNVRRGTLMALARQSLRRAELVQKNVSMIGEFLETESSTEPPNMR